MNKVRYLLLAYCALATIAVLILLVMNFRSSAGLAAELKQLRRQLEAAESEDQAAQRALRDLEIEQRSARPDYSAEQAIEMSFKVQLAIEKHQQTAQRVAELTATEASAADKYKARQLRLVPLFALLLLHVLGAAYFIRPARQSIMPR